MAAIRVSSLSSNPDHLDRNSCAIHSGQLRLRAAGNLLCAQLHELLLQIIQLLPQFILVLAPKLCGLDFAGGGLQQR